MLNRIAWIGLVAVLGLAPLPAFAQGSRSLQGEHDAQ